MSAGCRSVVGLRLCETQHESERSFRGVPSCPSWSKKKIWGQLQQFLINHEGHEEHEEGFNGTKNLGREMKRSRFLKGCLLAGFVFFAVSCVHAGDRRAGPLDQSDALLPASESSGLPVLDVPERVYDFGEHKGEGVIDHDFRVINSGTGVLRIVKLLPS
jgi:hypothetical protein